MIPANCRSLAHAQLKPDDFGAQVLPPRLPPAKEKHDINRSTSVVSHLGQRTESASLGVQMNVSKWQSQRLQR